MSHRLPETQSLIQQLVALPSVSSTEPEHDMSNEAVVDQLATWLGDIGFICNKQAVPNLPGKFNLIATLSGPNCSDQGGLLLSGHADTVPFDEGAWQYDPFAGAIKNGRMFGLGTADMKAFLAIATNFSARIDRQKLRHPLTIVATANEESGMEGARALSRALIGNADAAIIGEPTGLVPINAHKGVLMETIHVHGQAGHSSNPNLGINAIEGMHEVMTALYAFRDDLRQRHADARFSVPYPTLNTGCLCGGDNPNRIPSSSSLKIDLRVLPGMDNQIIRQELRQRLKAAMADSACGLSFDILFDGIPPFEMASDAALVRFASKSSGHAAEAVDFGTEGPYFKDLGLETIVMGPGSIDQAHQPNEYLDLAWIPKTEAILEKLIHKYCL